MANVQFHTLDPLGQSAIELGLDQINALSPIEEMTLELDELTKQKLKRLSSSMSLSIRTLIESAINYTYAYAVETHKTSAELQTLMPMPGTFPVQISLSLETSALALEQDSAITDFGGNDRSGGGEAVFGR